MASQHFGIYLSDRFGLVAAALELLAEPPASADADRLDRLRDLL